MSGKHCLWASVFLLLLAAEQELEAQASPDCRGEFLYEFQQGETLSEILWVVGRSDMWSPNGRIAKIVAAHPDAFQKGFFGHVLAGRELPISLEACPDSRYWKLENGRLMRMAASSSTDGDVSTPSHEGKSDAKIGLEAKPIVTPEATLELTPAPTPEPTPLPETESQKEFKKTMQNGDTGYSKMLENLSSEAAPASE